MILRLTTGFTSIRLLQYCYSGIRRKEFECINHIGFVPLEKICNGL